jgi:hypothetical protein
MKKIILSLFTVSFLLSSCRDAGTTELYLHGQEPTLPEELKGLKIYAVSDGYGSSIKVAVFEGQVVGTKYKSGKYSYDEVNVYKENGTSRSYPESSIIVENDSILVIKKK